MGPLERSMASSWSLLGARQNAQANALVRAVAEDFGTSESRSSARTFLQERFTSTSLSGLKDKAIAELRSVARLVETKPPEDAAAIKTWLQAVAQKAAEAGTEGGFLGFGGVAVSEAEKATLAEIAHALNQPSSSIS